MTKSEFINVLSEHIGGIKDEIEFDTLYDAVKFDFIDTAVKYFCGKWFPQKSIMFDKLSLERISEEMENDLDGLIQ